MRERERESNTNASESIEMINDIYLFVSMNLIKGESHLNE